MHGLPNATKAKSTEKRAFWIGVLVFGIGELPGTNSTRGLDLLDVVYVGGGLFPYISRLLDFGGQTGLSESSEWCFLMSCKIHINSSQHPHCIFFSFLSPDELKSSEPTK